MPETVALFGAAALAVLAGLSLLRLLAGPTLHDRVLGAHVGLVLLTLALAALSVALGDPRLADAALALAFSEAVLALASLKYFQLRGFQLPLHPRKGTPSDG